MTRSLILGVLFPLFACTSVAWQQPSPELPAGWRDYRLFVSDLAFVLARDERAAAEVHGLLETARSTVERSHPADPGRGLVLALSFEDPLPIADPERYGAALRDWHARVLGGQGRMELNIGEGVRMGPDGETVAVDPAMLLHMVAAPIVRGDPAIALPPALVEAATFAAIVPTESCLDECVDRMIDIALEAQGISWLTFQAMTLVAGNPATIMREKMLEHARNTICQAWLAELGVEPGAARDMVGEVIAHENGLPRGWTGVDPGARFSQSEPWFVVGRLLMFERDGGLLAPVAGVVNVQPYDDARTEANIVASGRRYLNLPKQDRVPSREDAERLGAFYDACRKDGKGTFVFLVGDPEYGAALVGAHAHLVLGRSQEDALQLAAELGAQRILPALLDSWHTDR